MKILTLLLYVCLATLAARPTSILADLITPIMGTGIGAIASSQEPTTDGQYYDLSGRRVANGQRPRAKGLYIRNGKKVVIK